MALRWTRRVNGKIVESASIRQAGMTEQIDEADQEYLDFKDEPFVAERQKQADIIAKMPTRAQIEAKFDSIKANATSAATLTELKIALAPLLDLSKEHAMVTYWLAKNSAI